MKKIFLMIIVILPLYLNAQFIKSDKVLGGSLQLDTRNQSTGDEPNYQNRNFSILPNFGFFVNDKIELGGVVGYSSNYQNVEESQFSIGYTSKSQSLTTGLYAQKYFSLTDKFLFALLVQSNFSRGNTISPQFDQGSGEYIDYKTLHYSINSSLRPTFYFFPSPQWGFKLSLASFNHTFNKNLTTDTKSNQFTLYYGGFSVGTSYYFRKQKD
jgi:hypothetical protein